MPENNVFITVADLPVPQEVDKDGGYVLGAQKNARNQLDLVKYPIGRILNKAELVKDGNWRYIRYADGRFEAWYNDPSYSVAITTAVNQMFRSETKTVSLPIALSSATVWDAHINLFKQGYAVWCALLNTYGGDIAFQALSSSSRNNTAYTCTIHVTGYTPPAPSNNIRITFTCAPRDGSDAGVEPESIEVTDREGNVLATGSFKFGDSVEFLGSTDPNDDNNNIWLNITYNAGLEFDTPPNCYTDADFIEIDDWHSTDYIQLYATIPQDFDEDAVSVTYVTTTRP